MFMMIVAFIVNAMLALYGVAQNNTAQVVFHIGIMIITVLVAILIEVSK